MGLRDRVVEWLVGEQAARALSEVKLFTPADEDADWPHINALVHGPGAPGWGTETSGDANSAVFACLMAIATAYPEPPLRVYRRRRDGNEEWLDGSPLQDLLDNPTPGGVLSIEDILFWVAWAKHTDGNAYVVKVRAGDAVRGNVIELWPVSPNQMWPITERGRDGRALDWISYYKMKVGPGKFTEVPVENVIHFRLGVDPEDRRKGLSPLKRLVRELAADDEATKFTDTLLSNYAVPGLVVIPGGMTHLTKTEADRIGDTFTEKFGSDNRGKVVVLSKETRVEKFGFSPEELNLTGLHRVPEERIAAVMGVPAIVAGLGAGLDRATYANARELREMFTEMKLVPQWRQDAARLNASLLPDFSSQRDVSVRFDISDVRALQEDENARYTRLNLAVSGARPFMLRNEARTDVGLDPIPGWDEADMAALPVPTSPAVAEADFGGDKGSATLLAEIRAARKAVAEHMEVVGTNGHH